MSTATKTGRPFVAVTSERNLALATQLDGHGEPVFLFEWRSRPRPFEPEKILELTIAALRARDFDPDSDAVVFTGQLVYVATLLAAVMMEHGRANVLVFDAVNERYVARRMKKR